MYRVRCFSSPVINFKQLRLYSSALACVQELNVQGSYSGRSQALFPVEGLSNGIYFYEMWGIKGGEKTAAVLGKLLILK